MTSAASSPTISTNVRFQERLAGLATTALPATVRALARLSPALGARLALELWVRPRRHAVPAREKAWVATARSIEVGGLPAWEWGRGPTVLLVHGWEGRASQMGALGTVLAEAGFRAVAIDLPGHGRASGSTLHMGTASASLARALDALGPTRAIVAHSFGAAVMAWTLQCGHWADRLVLLAPPDPSRVLERYAAWLGLPREVSARMEDLLADRAGVHPRELTGSAVAGGLGARGLVIHDPADPVVPFADGASYGSAWLGSEVVAARGTGHHRVLRDEAVVSRVAAFVADRVPRAA